MSSPSNPYTFNQPKKELSSTAVLCLLVIGCLVVFSVLGKIVNRPSPLLANTPASSSTARDNSTLAGSSSERKVFARYFEEEYRNGGFNMTISVSGVDNTTMLMSSPLFAGVERIDPDSLPAMKGLKTSLRKHGFREVIFSDGNMPVATTYLE